MPVKKLLLKVLLFLCLSNLWGQTKTAPSGDSWQLLAFLIGTWEAKTQGGSAGASASGTYSFGFELHKHVLARHTIDRGACKGPADFDCDHGDLLYIYPEGAGTSLKAIYFDNEGHVIHYDVSAATPTSAVFLSDASQPGPQFRLSYELKGSTMYGKFEVRPPGQKDFMAYLQWSGEKK